MNNFIKNTANKTISKIQKRVQRNISQRKVVNLSSVPLTTSETSLLSKGLSFTPTPTRFNLNEFNNDMDNLERTLSLKVYFSNETQNDKIKQYKPSSLDKILKNEKQNRFNPPIVNCIKTYNEAIKDEVQNCTQQKTKDNLTKRERAALERLQTRNDIIIKRADKGGATVIMNKTDYHNEAMRQLNNTDNYIREPQDNT